MAHLQSLFDATLAEHVGHHHQALAALNARRDDINELQRLTTALSARGLRVAPRVTTHPMGRAAYVKLHLHASCNARDLADALEWMTAADIGIERLPARESGCTRYYQLRLRRTYVDFHVMAYGDPRQVGATVGAAA